MGKLIAAGMLTVVYTIALQAGWNLGIAAAFGLPGLTFWQALASLVLARTLALLMDNGPREGKGR